MDWKSLGLLIPQVRRLYEHRNALLARVAVLESDLRCASERIAALEDERCHLMEVRGEIKECLNNIESCINTVAHVIKDRTIRAKALEATNGTYQQKDGSNIVPEWQETEIETCRALASRCLFVVGFARSNTTITLQILNTAHNALLLGEANFYQPRDTPRWREWYNAMHVSFRNQATKSAYAPDFVPDRDHTWWEWLKAASAYYDVLGDKMAFSSYHLSQPGPDVIQRFFEARFFNSKYVFLLRNPVDTLLSAAKLMRLDDDTAIRRECDAWLRYIQLWADWIRNFPYTLTLVVEEFGIDAIAKLAAFTGLSLAGAEILLHEGNRHHHVIPERFPTLAALKNELMEIYDLAKAALSQDRMLWQAEQKRPAYENDNKGDPPGRVAVVPRPLGHAWARAQDLRTKLAEISSGMRMN